MKIKQLHIQNFRGIKELEITSVDPQLNVIVGVNGAGKSSVLDSISFCLSWLIARMKSGVAKGVLPLETDVTLGAKLLIFVIYPRCQYVLIQF